MRSDPDDPLTGGDQRLLKPARDVPTVLDCPHSLVIEFACPAQRGQMPRLLRLDLAGPALATRSFLNSRQRVRALVGVRSDHDHLHRPLRLVEHRRSGPRRTTVTRGDATLLSSHAEGPRAATGDTSFAGQTKQTTQHSRVSPPPAREPSATVGRHRPDRNDSDSDSTFLTRLGIALPLGAACLEAGIDVDAAVCNSSLCGE